MYTNRLPTSISWKDYVKSERLVLDFENQQTNNAKNKENIFSAAWLVS